MGESANHFEPDLLVKVTQAQEAEINHLFNALEYSESFRRGLLARARVDTVENLSKEHASSLIKKLNDKVDFLAYRQAQTEDGLLFQDFVVDVAWQAGLAIAQYSSRAYQIAIGESRTGIEIKHDKKRKETGNLYIEYAEKARLRPGPYAPAGIMREGHWLFAIGDYDVIYFFANNLLRAFHAQKNARNQPTYRQIQKATSLGFLLPETVAQKCAALILQPDAEGKVTKAAQNLEALARDLHAAMFKDPNQLVLFN